MASVPPIPPKGLKFKLGLMMFLQFFIWGAWFEIGFDYFPQLGFHEKITLPEILGGEIEWQVPLILGAFNIGALVALFFSTQFADRKFAAEKFLAFSQLIGGLAIMGLFFIKPAEAKEMFWPFFLLMLVYSVFYVPTISITNSIAFANLRDPRGNSAWSGSGGRSVGSPRPGRSSSSWWTGRRCALSVRLDS